MSRRFLIELNEAIDIAYGVGCVYPIEGQSYSIGCNLDNCNMYIECVNPYTHEFEGGFFCQEFPTEEVPCYYSYSRNGSPTTYYLNNRELLEKGWFE